ncbi:MAG: sigma-70 family RNA polymerase sigma factor [Bacteroides sp.]|nr:sigma-70 family RNA polymerase sigma factor [Bacteroides sp.]MBD5301119.1 sigma-70 family RNA polymerase sigma factor [Bacteroides sp.]MBD5355332.1 sigma-70 family RNA polymerase sigma factor [Bacteroides sp.]MDE5828323.1 sigma-70 family RNA polymerase sigma factor [Duncaniella sp.]
MMDTECFKTLFLPLGRQMYAEALRILRDPAEAEDAVQDVYTRLWERRKELEGISNPRAYAFTMLRNHCISLFNSNARRHVDKPAEGLPEETGPNLGDEIDTRDRVSKIFGLIGNLPDNQRRIITMHDVEGRPKEEIEKATGLSAANVRQLLSRARKAVRSHFSK